MARKTYANKINTKKTSNSNKLHRAYESLHSAMSPSTIYKGQVEEAARWHKNILLCTFDHIAKWPSCGA